MLAQYTTDGRLVGTFVSAAAAAQATGIDRLGIGKCARNQRGTAGGFVWMFRDVRA